YSVGDTIQGAVIKKILRGKVIVRVGDRDEILLMEKDTTPKATKGSPVSKSSQGENITTVNRSELEGSLRNINSLLSQVRIRPYFKDGKPEGLSLTRITGGSLFDKLGLQDGDVIQGMDGRSIKGPDDILSLYKKLRSESRVSLDVMRKGVQRTLNLQFE
ncbi:MAG: PDZ domain-containing protein, partial [Pseudomonadota bacterium]